MKKYLTSSQEKRTPQSEPISGSSQTRNSAGGYTWKIDVWQRLARFLVLGSEGGSYYASQRTLTRENTNTIFACLREDGLRTVEMIVEFSTSGRIPKNDVAIFALAVAASAGNEGTRKAALNALPQVCRTGTHLFTFAEYIKGRRGWGRSLRRSIGNWYKDMPDRKLAYQLVKYRQRGGWSHTDLLRLSHPTPETDAQNALFKWVTHPDEATWKDDPVPAENDALAFIQAFEKTQKASDVETVLRLIKTYDLPREALPTQWLKDPAIWEALLEKMPLTALIRNLGVMGRVGLLTPFSNAEQEIAKRLTDRQYLQNARIHPITVLSALNVYRMGRSLRGGSRRGSRRSPFTRPSPVQQEWEPTAKVLEALEDAFEKSFKHLEPTGKNTLLALDVSGSMGIGMIAGVPGLTPRLGSTAMAMVTARTEPNYHIVGFSHELVPVKISARTGLDDAIQTVSKIPMGGTDCALPMLHALENKMDVETFIVYTDNETWFGDVHPARALERYRQTRGIDAKLIVVGMVANEFSIADPEDPGMLDVVGFDSAAPALMADFARGEI